MLIDHIPQMTVRLNPTFKLNFSALMSTTRKLDMSNCSDSADLDSFIVDKRLTDTIYASMRHN